MSQLDNEIIAFRDSMTKVSQFANGDENTDVQTTNGPVPSIAKVAKVARNIIDQITAVNQGASLRVDSVVTYTADQQHNAKINIGLDQVDNTPDTLKPVSQPMALAISEALGTINSKEDPQNKNKANGYVGLSGMRFVMRNVSDTVTNYLTTASTDTRIWTLPDKSGILALTTDLPANLSGVNTGDETQATILAKLQIQAIAGINTGDESTGSILNKLNITAAEDTANKAVNFGVVNNTLYPTVQAVKFYVDNTMVGVIRDCGNYDASTNTWPTTGGTGVGGAIVKGNFWYVSTPGILGGVAVNIGDSFRAMVDAPAQIDANWSVLESNLGYVPYNATNPAGYISGITGQMVSDALTFAPLGPGDRNAINGVAGLTNYALNLMNNAGSVMSVVVNTNTASRTYNLPDKDGTIALISDVIANYPGPATITINGDANGSGTTTIPLTINNNAVTLAKLAQIPTATFLGRTTAATGNVENLTLTQVKTMLAIDQVSNTADADKPVSSAQLTALNAKENLSNKVVDFTVTDNVKYPTTLAVKNYFDNRLTNVVVDCGSWDASGGTYPTTGGTGTSGAIVKGNLFFVSVAGALGAKAVNIGDSFRALVDAPGQVDANWDVLESNLGYVPYNSTNPAGYISGITAPMVTTALGYAPVSSATKDAPDGIVGLTAYKINFKNSTGANTSYMQHSNTASRSYTFPDKDGQVALMSDITGTNSGINTGDQTITLTGDVMGTGTGTFITAITNNAVTFGKMQQVTTATFLGRNSAGSGNIETLSATTVKTMLSLNNVDNTSDVNKPVSSAQQTALNAKESLTNKASDFSVLDNTKYPTTQAVKTLVDSVAAGVATNTWIDCGNYDASTNAYPSTGGTGTSNAIKRGNTWTISVAGTLGGNAVKPGDTVRALVDTPGTTASNWTVLENNLGYDALNKAGDAMTGVLGLMPFGTIASAATVDMNSATSNMVEVTGTTTITAITLADGAFRFVRFAGRLTLTNGASLILPTAANIQTSVGDTAVFVGKGTTTLCLVYQSANGGSALVAGKDRTRAVTANGATSIDLNTGDQATMFEVTLSANSTITFTNPPALNNETFSFSMRTINGADSLAMGFGNTIKWAGGSVPPRTTTNGAIDLWTFLYDNGVYYGSLAIQDAK